MAENAYLGEIATAFFYLFVGVRLLRLASRTGEVPERQLGAMFLVMGVSYVVYDLPMILGSEALWTPLNFVGRVIFIPAPIILAIFTRRVFRPRSVWAAWFVRGCAALLVAGVAGSALRGDWEGYSVGDPWFWLEWTGYTIPFGWAGIESLIQHRQARRRMKLGLGHSLVCNRLLLWGLYGTLAAVVSMAIPLQHWAYEQERVFNATWDALISAGEILSILPMWLVFFPPARYRTWIIARAVRASAARGR
jgi:hypothetical protein